MSYLQLPLTLEAEAIVEAMEADMAARIPGWVASSANPEEFIFRAVAYRSTAPLAQLTVDVADQVFEQFGAQVAGVPPIEASPATVQSTWTMIDDAGYTIPAGSQVDVQVSGDESVGFLVQDDVSVPAGETTTDFGGVSLEAAEPGTTGNGLNGSASSVDALVGVDTITLVGTSSGGVDAEDPLAYLARLTATMQTFGPHPILPRDVEILARAIPGVARATTCDLFDPDTDDPDDPSSWLSERHCSVAVVDAEGAPCSGPVKAALLADLQAKREVNFVFHVLDPDYTPVDVEFQIVVKSGFDQATAESDVIARLTDFLSPARWGLGDQGDATIWLNERVVRFQNLVTLVNDTQGVDYYVTLELAATGDPLGTADVTLSGAAPLPQAGTIQVAAS